VVQLPHLIYSYNPFRGALATAQNDGKSHFPKLSLAS
jgi:hypothetical protein